jgi:isopenicillin N synthase-like dioxygenase
LDSSHGTVYRETSRAPPRAAIAKEIPIINLSKISSKNLEDRRSIALKIQAGAEKTGVFYIENHGVEEGMIENAKAAAMK